MSYKQIMPSSGLILSSFHFAEIQKSFSLSEPGEAKIASYSDNHAFRSVLGLSAVVATTVILACPAVALDRLFLLGDIDVRQLLAGACDRVEKLTDEAVLLNLQRSILDIQARVTREDSVRVHADFEASARFEAEKRKRDQLETDIKELKSKDSDKGRLERAETVLAQQKNVVESAWKAFQEADDKQKEANTKSLKV